MRYLRHRLRLPYRYIVTPAQLLDATLTLGEFRWSNPSDIDTSGVHHGYRQISFTNTLYTLWEEVLAPWQPVKNAWLSRIDPGGYILLHRDASPWLERWQVPIEPAGTMMVEGEKINQTRGPFRVEQWKWHAVENFTSVPRIHLVLDRDKIGHRGEGKFEVL